MKKILYLFLIVIIFSGCKKNPNVTKQDQKVASKNNRTVRISFNEKDNWAYILEKEKSSTVHNGFLKYKSKSLITNEFPRENVIIYTPVGLYYFTMAEDQFSSGGWFSIDDLIKYTQKDKAEYVFPFKYEVEQNITIKQEDLKMGYYESLTGLKKKGTPSGWVNLAVDNNLYGSYWVSRKISYWCAPEKIHITFNNLVKKVEKKE